MAKKASRPDGSETDKLTEEDKKRAHEIRIRICEGVIFLLGILAVGGIAFLIACAVFYWPVAAAVGKDTTVNVTQNLIANFKIDVLLGWAVGLGGMTWGYLERKSKMRDRKTKDERIIELEKRLDPSRTSSGLTPNGNIGN